MNRLKELLEYLNEKGIPLPQARDHGRGSVSFTLLVLSSVFVMASLVGEVHPILAGIDFWQAWMWHVTCALLYYNRGGKISKSGIEISASEKPKQETKK